jgi:DNA end-binding protein Ku
MKSIWSGTLSFGLVHVPVNLYSASVERKLHFNYLRKKDLCPIKYVKVCKFTGEEVPYSDIVRGFEYQKGDYVVLQDEDLKQANVEKTETIEILEFVKANEIDEIYLEKPYYIEPQKQATKAYVILREALKKSKKVGVAKFVLRTREHLAIIKPEGEMLILNQMRFHDEIRDPEGLNIPKTAKYNKKELDIAIQLVEQLSVPFKPKDFHDTYTEELEKIILAKSKGKLKRFKKGKVPVATEVPDLMSKLRESLEKARKKEHA